MEISIITGMSGAGKSTVVKNMEDMGYYCVDNLPPMLLPKFIELTDKSKGDFSKVAIVIDIRGGKFFDDFINQLDELKYKGYSYNVLFLECENEELIKRFKETRRTHPLSYNGKIEEGIINERNILKNIKKVSNIILDTTYLNIKELKSEMQKIFSSGDIGENLTISLNSFGFKYGIPLDADLVFDIRFLRNPYYKKELRELTGDDSIVRDYVMDDEVSKEFMKKLKDMLIFLIPQYIKEGKTNLVVSIGCTGGKHRSVTFVHLINKYLREEGYRVIISHRDKLK